MIPGRPRCATAIGDVATVRVHSVSSLRDEVERLREEVVRLQARIEELEIAAAARERVTPVTRRGLASLIPGITAERAG